MNNFLRSLVLVFLGLGQVAMAQSVITIKDGDLQANQTYNWTSNNVYLLDGYVYLETGGKLIIEPGTVVKGKTVPTSSDRTSALIITRGAQIFAEGTATSPIIFTGEVDDLTTTTDVTSADNQLWGGLIILGNAPIGEDGGTDVIEGIPSSETRIAYGGTNANDNSGILKYVSVRHGGSVLGADNEINGITLGGVGRGTTIDYVEVFGNKDDGIEVFGGTVNITHALVAFVGDDSFDFDESWNGYMQFLFSIQDGVTNGDYAVEYDGSEEANKLPKTVGRIYNGTFIGSGSASGTDSDGLRLRNDGAAQFWNCIWTQIPGIVFRVDDTSRDRLRTAESAFRNNIAVQYGTLAFGNDPIVLGAWINGGNGAVTNPQLASISRVPGGNLDPRPQAGSAALTGAAVPSEAGVQAVPYRGAFSNVENWALGWSALDQYGYFGNKVTIDNVINDARIQAGQAWVLNNEVEWILDGLVYVEAGASLTIEPGTVIKGKNVPTSSADISSSLVISRGAKIFAEGTRTQPIIFTSELDDLSTTTDLTSADRRLWGGVIVLGSAPVGEDGGTDVIEGIPSTEPRINYGGTNAADNSGVMKYVSIRHGGSILAADNEINGLTLGGVGNGTEIDYVEIFSTEDDGIEIFGGTVNVKHIALAFPGDDGFDVDESWNGYGQFIFAIAPNENAIEYDGTESATFSCATEPAGRIYNGTFIGNRANSISRGARIRNNGSAQIWNTIITNVADYAYRFDANSCGANAVAGNIAFNFGTLVNGTRPATFQAEDVNPGLAGISLMPNGGLDPRPNKGAAALSGAATLASNEAEQTTYRGAFSNADNWATGWTALDAYGFFGDLAEKQIVTLRDSDINAGESLTLTNDVEWLLDGFVYVENGATLTIEPGTVIKGKTVPSSSDLTSALIIARGGKIFAEGTVDAPIIFTSELDDLTITTDLGAADRRLWGGIIVLGAAPVGEDGGQDVIEGIPSNEPRIVYGGTNATDNSGIIKYVSIRHGGNVLGADNEINGLTLGGVGRGTTVDYVEIFANEDDGIEIFGGTVNVKHILLAFVGDDAFDVDESWSGFGQYIFSIAPNENAIEYDGTEAVSFSCATEPAGRIYNGTFIGNRANSISRGARIRNNASAQIWNSIITDVADYAYRFDANSCGANAVAGNIAFNFGTLVAGTRPTTFQVEQVNPGLGGIALTPTGGLDPRPNSNAAAAAGAATLASNEAEQTTYRGAFSNRENWAAGWTAMDAYGYFGDLATQASNVITDASIKAGETLTLTNDVEWLLDGYVYVEAGATIIIEPGTVIKGKTVPSSSDLTSALIIARGGKIIADGTADAPIIFTSELDDLSITTDLTASDRRLWGGVIVLGSAPVGEDGGTDVIEGIASTEPRIAYGGSNVSDNSGIIRYVSIRHGGNVLGADNEINGLTLGGVGNGTTVDYVEIFANEDDGIEIFGGSVNVKHIALAFVGDDSFDVDESWSGFGQYIFSIAPNENGIEYDGTESATFSCATEPAGRIYNGTFIGNRANSISRGARIRNNANAQIWNSIFTDVADYAYRFDANSCGANAVAGNIAFNFTTLVNGTRPATFQVEEVNPGFGGVSLLPSGGLDPRPNAGAAALSGAATLASGEAEQTTFRGAFSNTNNWAAGWTALDAYGYFGDLASEVIEADLALTLTSDKATVGIFERFTLTAKLTNNGPSATTGVTVSAGLPAGTVFSSFSATAGTYRSVTKIWEVGALASGESQTLTLVLFTLVRNQPIPAVVSVVTSDVVDPVAANNTASFTVNAPGANLAGGNNGAQLADVAVYPNPATTFVTVKVTTTADANTTAFIYDATGRVVAQQNIALVNGTNNFDINVRTLPEGYYYIQIAGVETALTFYKR